jgi:tubulin-specific chaperone A
MMEESSKMITDSINRLQKAVTDLRTLVVRRTLPALVVCSWHLSQISAAKEDTLAADQEFLKAKETLEVASS